VPQPLAYYFVKCIVPFEIELSDDSKAFANANCVKPAAARACAIFFPEISKTLTIGTDKTNAILLPVNTNLVSIWS
jgi:hypothetical protein